MEKRQREHVKQASEQLAKEITKEIGGSKLFPDLPPSLREWLWVEAFPLATAFGVSWNDFLAWAFEHHHARNPHWPLEMVTEYGVVFRIDLGFRPYTSVRAVVTDLFRDEGSVPIDPRLLGHYRQLYIPRGLAVEFVTEAVQSKRLQLERLLPEHHHQSIISKVESLKMVLQA